MCAWRLVYLMDSHSHTHAHTYARACSNAYYYGFLKSKTIVLFDTLFEQPKDEKDGETKTEGEGEGEHKDVADPTTQHRCNDDEVLGILSHELGHWKLNHTMKHFAIAQVWPWPLCVTAHMHRQVAGLL